MRDGWYHIEHVGGGKNRFLYFDKASRSVFHPSPFYTFEWVSKEHATLFDADDAHDTLRDMRDDFLVELEIADPDSLRLVRAI